MLTTKISPVFEQNRVELPHAVFRIKLVPQGDARKSLLSYLSLREQILQAAALDLGWRQWRTLLRWISAFMSKEVALVLLRLQVWTISSGREFPLYE